MDIYKKLSLLIICSLLLILCGCATQHHHRIPVRDIWRQPLKGNATYVVQAGDTLYSIAWAYGLDYRQVAAANNINPPTYHIEVGQRLALAASESLHKSKPIKTVKAQPVKAAKQSVATKQQPSPPVAAPAATPPPAQQTQSAATVKPQFMTVRTVQHEGIAWAWPARGRIICTFSSNNLAKGIDLAGKSGAPVLAAASGKVVYASNGLRGYGLLIIIKHNDDYLSAYAHNQKLLVSEGQNVRVGQVIARMGSTEARRVMLHFEIRKAGKPVDPLQYLPAR